MDGFTTRGEFRIRIVASFVFSLICLYAHNGLAQNNFRWDLPFWAPTPIVPADNLMSVAKVDLGRRLFYEKNLSINRTMSCGTCHQQEKAFTDGKRVAIGATREKHSKNTPTLTNVAYSSILTLADPKARRLEDHPLTPLFSSDPVEMGMNGQDLRIVDFLESDPVYNSSFKASFPESKAKVSIENIGKALAAFQRTLISLSSPYDLFRYNKDENAISISAKKGEKLFFSERLNCFQCHQAPFFTDSYSFSGLPFEEIAFHNTGLYNLSGNGGYPVTDTGLHKHTGKSGDMGRFRTPSLRNIALTAPYMHDGSIDTLDEVLEFYSRGGRKIEKGALAGDGARNPFKSSFVRGFLLSPTEKREVVSFLNSLTDISFVQDPGYSLPR
jgi:cytochrome c peroxidase